MAGVVAVGFSTFSIALNLACLFIGFSLFLGGAASLSSLFNGNLCGEPGFSFGNCTIVKTLAAVSWIAWCGSTVLARFQLTYTGLRSRIFIIIAMITVGFIAAIEKEDNNGEPVTAPTPTATTMSEAARPSV